MKTSAVIVDAVRTATAKRNGGLASVHPNDLVATVLRALVARAAIDPTQIEDVIVGCVTQTGEQGLNVARGAVLAAGFPESVPATTVDRQCGSSQQAAHFAAQGVMAGAYDVVIAAGVEHMTRVPMGSNTQPGEQYSPQVHQRYAANGGLPTLAQGLAAEMVADRWNVTRDALDEFAVESHRRAARATDEGRFEAEIVPVRIDGAAPFARDEGIRRDSSTETLGTLRPVFAEGGKITAGNSSQISDGAAAMLIMSERRATELGLTPRARFHTFALAGVSPVEMLTGPIPATAKALHRSGLRLDEIDVFEVNEAFASVVLAWLAEVGADPAKVNVNGGAIALGHPLGASGARLMTTMLYELERSGGRYGLQAVCEAGGMANATILERL